MGALGTAMVAIWRSKVSSDEYRLAHQDLIARLEKHEAREEEALEAIRDRLDLLERRGRIDP